MFQLSAERFDQGRLESTFNNIHYDYESLTSSRVCRQTRYSHQRRRGLHRIYTRDDVRLRWGRSRFRKFGEGMILGFTRRLGSQLTLFDN